MVWQLTLKHTLLPSIPMSPQAKVADLGAGNCIWLLEMARKYPDASLHAFDISNAQYPPKEFIPANMTLNTLDVFSDIPDELVGIFDVVHIRLWVAIVRDGDPGPVLAKAKTLLSKSKLIRLSMAHEISDTIADVAQ